MRHILQVVVGLSIAFILVGCTEEESIPAITSESIITMENVDDYLYRDDVQYVDLRNFNSRYHSGYIDGFESLPFFDYLDYRVFNRNDVFVFEPDQLLDTREIEELFDKDKAIFLYADGCIRSGYIHDVLTYLGYDRVFVLGGFYEYVGEHLILGSGDFEFGNTFSSSYHSINEDITYYMYGTFNMGRKILTIRFDMIDADGHTMRGQHYSVDIDYNEQLTTLENFIVQDLVTFNELIEHLTDPTAFGYDQIEGYDLGFSEDFLELIETLVINP